MQIVTDTILNYENYYYGKKVVVEEWYEMHSLKSVVYPHADPNRKITCNHGWVQLIKYWK